MLNYFILLLVLQFVEFNMMQDKYIKQFVYVLCMYRFNDLQLSGQVQFLFFFCCKLKDVDFWSLVYIGIDDRLSLIIVIIDYGQVQFYNLKQNIIEFMYFE